MEKCKWIWALTATAAGVAVTLLLPPGVRAAPERSTQTFSPSRYALLAAEVNAASLQRDGDGGPVTRRVALKLDTQTGQVWVLQLSVAGENDPRVLNAMWAPVQSGGVFTVVPPQQNGTDPGF